jgi:endoglucanase
MRIKIWLRVLLGMLTVAGLLGSLAEVVDAAAQVATTKVLTIMLENHSRSQTRSTGQMPYLDSLADAYGDASNFLALTHPSLGNYFAAQSGQGIDTCGMWDPSPSACPQSGTTVMDQAIASGKTARYYAEAMPANCSSSDANGYVAHHNPWTYFPNAISKQNCLAHDVPSGSTTSGNFLADLNAAELPNVAWLIPNNSNNGHSGSLAVADAWLEAWLPKIIASPDYQAGRLAVAITWDEPDPTAPVSTPIEFVFISPRVSSTKTASRYDLFSWLRYQEDVLGVSYLGQAASAADLRNWVPITGVTSTASPSPTATWTSTPPTSPTAASSTTAASSPTQTCTPTKPVVSDTSATNIVGSSTTLTGNVNPNGSTTKTNFEWGPTSSLGHGTNKTAVGSGCTPVAISATISGLTPGQTYYYRLIAESPNGNTYPSPKTFVADSGAAGTSSAPPTTSAPTTTSAPATTASPSASPPPPTLFPVRFKAVNKAGTEYACIQGWGFFDGPTDDASVTTMKTWNINAVRLPLNEDCWLGINNSPAAYSGPNYRAAVARYVSTLNAQGVYVILDLHWSAPGGTLATGQNNMADKDHSPAFWSSVATTFRDNAMVLFDLYNEPHGISWSVWKSGDATYAGMDQLISAIRSAGAMNWVIASGLEWGNDMRGWLANQPTDPTGHLAAGIHVYNFNRCVTATCWNAEVKPVLQSRPLVITEMGENDCAAAFVSSLFSWADANGVSGYSPWSWNTSMSCAGGPGLITDNSGNPTPYGRGVKDWYTTH